MAHVAPTLTPEQELLREGLRQRDEYLAALYEASQIFLAQIEPRAILESACRLVVTRLGFKMAWAGLARENHFDVRPVAAYGVEEGYLDSIRVTWDDDPRGQGPAGTAVRTSYTERK